MQSEKPNTYLLAVRPALGFDTHISGSIAPIRGCTGGGGGGCIIARQEQGVAADSGMSHSCSLAQMLFARAMLFKVDDAAASHIAHLQQYERSLIPNAHLWCCNRDDVIISSSCGSEAVRGIAANFKLQETSCQQYNRLQQIGT